VDKESRRSLPIDGWQEIEEIVETMIQREETANSPASVNANVPIELRDNAWVETI